MSREYESRTLEQLLEDGRTDGAYLDFCHTVEAIVKRPLTDDEREGIRIKCEYWFLVRIEADRYEAAADYITNLPPDDE